MNKLYSKTKKCTLHPEPLFERCFCGDCFGRGTSTFDISVNNVILAVKVVLFYI